MDILKTLFLSNIGNKNVFYNILEQKNDFLRLWFWSKNGNFSNFLFLDSIG